MRTLFHSGKCDLYRLVPEDRPVPYFLTDGRWQFQGKVEGGPANELPKAAEVAIIRLSSSL